MDGEIMNDYHFWAAVAASLLSLALFGIYLIKPKFEGTPEMIRYHKTLHSHTQLVIWVSALIFAIVFFMIMQSFPWDIFNYSSGMIE